jgi:polyhydroxyalkanoate synthesis regulator phasin
MTENDGLRRYVDAATTLTQITRSRAEELVRELIKAGELERHRAQEWVEELVKVSRERSEALVATVRGEVRQQLKELGFTNVDDLARKVADILARSSAAGRKVTHRPARRARKTTAAKKTATQKGAPRKTAAVKKTGAKKTAAKKTAAKKTAARKATGTKKAGAKKAGA